MPQLNMRSLDIVLATIGSAGDVHPVIELATALKARGHRATMVTNEFFGEQIRGAGIDFIAMGTIQEANDAVADPRLWHKTKAFGCIVERAIVPNISRLYEILSQRCTAETVVAASSICFGAHIAREKIGFPLAIVNLQPAVFRSMYDAGYQGRIRMGPGMPAFVKRSLFWLFDTLLIDRLLCPPINSNRARLGLPPVSGIFKQYNQSAQLVLCLFPEWFAPAQPDWPPNTHLAGFVLHDASEHYAVPPEVEEFMAAGAAPIVFTPGSAASTLRDFFRESVEACRVGGFRAMLVTNYPEQLPGDLPRGVRAFSYLPFGRILPRAATLVYAGGVGTCAQAIKAAVPQLVVPQAYDQPDNAARVERLGLGYRVYPEKYKAKRVAQMLAALQGSSAIRQRCGEYSAKIDTAASLRRACELIENLGSTATNAIAGK
jgi:rhamnosyltransferase subunit B